MKTILINPPQNTKYPQPPLGLASIAAVLEQKGHLVEIIDANALQLSDREIVMKVKGADVIGITAMTPAINSAIKIAKEIKREDPEQTIILGGPHATILPEETLNKAPQIDMIVRGEGEKTMWELFDALENNKDLQNINGLTFRNNGIRSTPSQPSIVDLDNLPFLAYHLLPIHKYKLHPPHGRKLPYMAMMTSRGCPYNCIYCSKPIFGQKFRAQSPERTVDEVEYLIDKFKIKEIVFYDDSFTLNKNRIFQLCEEIHKRKIDIIWSCETRVDLVNEELLKAMKKAGCYMIAYGIEAGNQMILNNLRKKITTEQIRSAIDLTHKAGIQSVGYFMLGSPWETPATIRETVDFTKSLKLDFAQFSVMIPFPGTDIFELYMKSGHVTSNWDDYIYASLKSASTPVLKPGCFQRKSYRHGMQGLIKNFISGVLICGKE
ncbi:MAG: B12-binding domain-containing radical SAM protein [Euryarchaeota archaeon]|nr:B12-binding domain-containing radical SAM protein [Euryarchaeota archaeon]MCG2738008.1 B12-binding domain-containing radical SAM protein [Candidatus Methanoperedenaceae archaeon]